MNDPETNPYRPTQERGGLSAKQQRVNTMLPLISGAAYATLSLIIFLAIATFGEALPVVAVLLLSIVIVPYYVTEFVGDTRLQQVFRLQPQEFIGDTRLQQGICWGHTFATGVSITTT